MEREGEEKSEDKEGDKKPLVFRGTVESRITTGFNLYARCTRIILPFFSKVSNFPFIAVKYALKLKFGSNPSRFVKVEEGGIEEEVN